MEITNVEVCGRQVSNQCGDIHVFYGMDRSDYYVLEMKYVKKENSGTWHNTSVDFLPILFPGEGFVTAKQMMNSPAKNIYDVNGKLQFACGGNSFYKCLVALLEPFTSTNAIENLPVPKNDSSPIKASGISVETFEKGVQKVLMTTDGRNVFARFIDDTNSKEVKLKNPRYWKFNGESEICIDPPTIYGVQSLLANYWMEMMKENHFNILKGSPELLAELYDNIFSKTMTTNGKRK